jgi:endonuclease/exonuclease/phosphatase family metal-dependent hydrolase
MKVLRNIIRYTLLVFNIISAIIFLGCCASAYISPATLPFFAVFSLTFPIILVVNLIWPFFWLVTHRRYALVSTIALAMGLMNILNYISLFPTPDKLTETEQHLKVMSYNVRNFDLYNWTHNQESKKRIMDLIKKTDPDVLCLQEFYTDETKGFNTLAELKRIYPYYHFRRSLTLENSKYWGQATFSKYPIKERELMRFPNSKHNMVLVTDIQVRDTIISVYNVHLQSFQFDYSDYESMEHIGINEEIQKVPFKKWYRKLRDATVRRASQAETLAAHMSRNDKKIILCGDFNDSPNSYAYHTLSKGMNDAFHESEWGFGTTYNGPFPSLRIDYILVRPEIHVSNHEILHEQSSDHYAVVTEVGL